jgi:hypothetical protein
MSAAKAWTAEDKAKAQGLAHKISGKVNDALSPLALEMELMSWKPEYRAIVWEAVAMEALKRLKAVSP